jgi:hypothetical protein
MAWILLGYGNLPSLKAINPNIILENTMNAHLFGFKLIQKYFTLLNYKCAKYQIISLTFGPSEVV